MTKVPRYMPRNSSKTIVLDFRNLILIYGNSEVRVPSIGTANSIMKPRIADVQLKGICEKRSLGG